MPEASDSSTHSSKLRRIGLLLSSLAVATVWAPSARGDTDPSQSERVAARAAILRFYASHQIGSANPLQDTLLEVAERQVLDDLKKAELLRSRWGREVSRDAVDRELSRIVTSTRMPDRLQSLLGWLGGDLEALRESLVRPVLVDREVRALYARDSEIHAARHREAESLRNELARGNFSARSDHSESWTENAAEDGPMVPEGVGALDPVLGARRKGVRARTANPVDAASAGVGPILEREDRFEFELWGSVTRHYVIHKVGWDEWWSSGGAERDVVEKALDSRVHTAIGFDESSVCGDEWNNGVLDDVPEGATFPRAVWTGAYAIFWGDSARNSGKYDPLTDVWSRISGIGAPDMSSGHSAVWTGTEMIVWGGRASDPTNTGARYDPVTDQWTSTSIVGAPSPRESHTAIWTGSRMIVWGGAVPGTWFADGGAYDPVSDSWTPVTSAGAPIARADHTAVWTGSRMVVWGGSDDTNTLLGSGGRYDPASGTWAPMTNSQAPSARKFHTAVWAGNRMIVWGGASGTPPDWTPLGTGGRYDPATDSWSKLATRDAPSARHRHTAVWSGSRMAVWGGLAQNGGPYFNTGGRYDPAQDRWTGMTTNAAPNGRVGHAAVFGAGVMTIWGGSFGGKDNSGGRYDPVADSWTPTFTAGAPGGRNGFSQVWTGTHLVVWGGRDSGSLNTGGRYDPMLDSWTPTTTTGAPSARSSHSAVWTGSRMFVWGGANSASLRFADGASYDPIADAWQPMGSANAPSARDHHTAVWTGTEMIVWGGSTLTGQTSTGGRYSPAAGVWTPTTTLGAPLARQSHTAVWTGSKMIVWGSRLDGTTFLYADDGGTYDPTTDQWTPTSLAAAPQGRHNHSAIWDGARMVVWGGDDGQGFYWRTGGRYDPATDTWAPTSLVGHPLQRIGHSAVWNGSEMVVWGGIFNDNYQDGFRYDPSSDVWTPISIAGAPTARSFHAAAWTGEQMIVWGGDGYRNDGGRYIPPAPAPAGSATMTLAKSGATATLSWGAVTDATAYDVARGSIGSLRQSSGDFAASTDSCRANDVAGTTADDTQGPAVDNGYWYLVRPVRCSAAGSYDSAAPTQIGTRDAEIAASAVACP